MQFLKTLGMISLFAIAASAGPGKFANTCREVEGYGSSLRAECQEHEDGELRRSTIDINRCIKNHRGSLKCGKNGNYQGSCINCSLRGHTDFQCMCRNIDEGHSYQPTHIDLNKCISNNHGQLSC